MLNTNSSLISLKTAFYKPFTDTLVRWYILNSVDCNTIAVLRKYIGKNSYCYACIEKSSLFHFYGGIRDTSIS